jgi:hypothetical protein
MAADDRSVCSRGGRGSRGRHLTATNVKDDPIVVGLVAAVGVLLLASLVLVGLLFMKSTTSAQAELPAVEAPAH